MQADQIRIKLARSLNKNINFFFPFLSGSSDCCHDDTSLLTLVSVIQ